METVTVQQRGWGEKTNGALIEAAQREFDPLVTINLSIPHQPNLTEADLVILLLEARSNRPKDLMPLVDGAKAAPAEARRAE